MKIFKIMKVRFYLILASLLLVNNITLGQTNPSNAMKTHIQFSVLLLPELSLETPFGSQSRSFRISLSPSLGFKNSSTVHNVLPTLKGEFRFYSRESHSAGLFEGGYIGVLGKGFYFEDRYIGSIGLVYGTQTYFGKKNITFFEFAIGMQKWSEDIGFFKLDVYPILKLNFGFRII